VLLLAIRNNFKYRKSLRGIRDNKESKEDNDNTVLYLKKVAYLEHSKLLGFFGPRPPSVILRTREHSLSETGSVSVLRCEEGHILCWVS
jgi:hypothetical protein